MRHASTNILSMSMVAVKPMGDTMKAATVPDLAHDGHSSPENVNRDFLAFVTSGPEARRLPADR
jgi:hypothetical protein